MMLTIEGEKLHCKAHENESISPSSFRCSESISVSLFQINTMINFGLVYLCSDVYKRRKYMGTLNNWKHCEAHDLG